MKWDSGSISGIRWATCLLLALTSLATVSYTSPGSAPEHPKERLACGTITVSPATLPDGTVGAPYSQTVAASGGSPLYEYSIISGAPPTGLNLDIFTGAITGTPSEPGVYGFTVMAYDSMSCTGYQDYTIQINCPGTTITLAPPTLPNGVISTPYSQTIVASGGTPPYFYTVASGTLPPETSLDPATGTISGTPPGGGTFNFLVAAIDAASCPGSRAYSVTITCPASITMTPATFPDGTIGVPYSQTISAAGGTSPYTYTVTAGALPSGLTLGGSTGTITGTPSVSIGTYNFTVKATDVNGCSGSKACSIKINCAAAIALTPATLPDGTLGVVYSQSVVASGGTFPYTYSISAGALPPGLTWGGPSTGSIWGTPTAPGVFNFTASVSDTTGCSGSRSYSINIACPDSIALSPAALPNGTAGIAYAQTISASGGAAPYTYAITAGSLPAGMAIGPSTGTISGTPTAGGISNFTVTATDSIGCSGSSAYSLTVLVICSLSCTAGAPVGGNAGDAIPFTSTATTSFCTGSPSYDWSFGDGETSSLQNPSHIYTAAGTYDWNLRVTVDSETCTRVGSITILPPPPLVSTVHSGFCPEYGFSMYGSNFQPGISAYVNHVAAPLTEWISSAEIRIGGSGLMAIAPPGTVISFELHNPDGGISPSIVYNSSPAHDPVITQQPQSQDVADGQSVTLTVATETPAYCYQWYQVVGSDLIPVGGSSSSFTTPPIHQNTTYRVRVGTDTGQATSQDALLNVCGLSCSAQVPIAAAHDIPVQFLAQATLQHCLGEAQFYWTFGDGGTSTDQNPSHAYTAGGVFNWSLRVTVPSVTCDRSGSIMITPPCSVACTATAPASGPVNQPISFQATATPTGCAGNPAFAWAFGDGGSSSEQNPNHTYAVAGTYEWTLTVTAEDQICTRGGSITVSQSCLLSCTATVPASGSVGQPVPFQSVATPTNCTVSPIYDWIFGDGGSSSEQNPNHTYAVAGTFSWSLTVTVENRACSRSGTIVISLPCTVACTASVPATGSAGAAIPFASTATASNCSGTPAFEWTFGDGGTSSQQNPYHTYDAAGSYSWTLTVAADSQTCEQSGTIAVAPPCTIICTAEVPTNGAVGSAIAFSSTVTQSNCDGLPTFAWAFGDGETSTLQSPGHTYGAGGSYSWTLTVTVQDVTCVRQGEIAIGDPSTLACAASSEPASGAAPLSVAFTGSASGGTPPYTFNWQFGDGQLSQEQNPTHEYAAPGIYQWVLTVAAGGSTCLRSGKITATYPIGSISGRAVILDGAQFALLDGSGIVSGTASARNVETGDVRTAPLLRGLFEFPGLPLGSYEVRVDITYKDNITYGAQTGEMGCAAPTGGFINKSIGSAVHYVDLHDQGVEAVDVVFPSPIFFLHGILSCYEKWYSDGLASGEYWDNFARSEGVFSFTPGYSWGERVDWELAAGQVVEQVAADLEGLHMPDGLTPSHQLPYLLVTHDAGGLVARVLFSGQQAANPAVEAVQEIYLMGVPNSGSDLIFGQGAGSPVSEFSIVERFNELYPGFGPAGGKIYAIGGTRNLWGLSNGDGKVSLASAFNISRLHCVSDGGTPTCAQYVFQSFDSSEGHTFSFSHGELGGPPSTSDILDRTIIKGLLGEGSGSPESPAGALVWGTNSRTVGTASGTVGSFESGFEYPFTIGSSDGVAVLAWLIQGSAAFDVLDPSGNVATGIGGGQWEDGYQFQALNPAPGEWRLRVTPGSGGATFKAIFLEDAPFWFYGYTDKEAYPPGGLAVLRLDPIGDMANVAFGPATVTFFDPSGNILPSVPLYDDGSHGDGLAGDGRYAVEAVAPFVPGSYRLRFDAAGSYAGVTFSRRSEGALDVLPATHIFTGQFDFAPTDADASGKFDSLSFSAGAVFTSSAPLTFSADLYDGDGNLLDQASSVCEPPEAGPGRAELIFSLAGLNCSQLETVLEAREIKLSETSTLAAADLWAGPVESPLFDPVAFDCAGGELEPSILSVYSDEGVRGTAMTISIAGTNFADGCAVSLGEGINTIGVLRLSGELLSVSVSVLPDALTGKRAVIVTNPGGAAAELPGAFEVKGNQPPAVTILAPQDGATLVESAIVSASATDDMGIAEVRFLVDGTSKAVATIFPFSFSWNTKDTPNGEHSLVAVAKDSSGLTATSQPVNVILANPTIPGDCDGSGTVAIGEVQKAINMFLGAAQPDCGVDCNGDGQVSIGEVQKVINAFLGLPASC